MINTIEVRNPNGALLSLTFEDTNTGYIIEDVGGITPVKATIVTSSFGQSDGVQYHATHREARNVTIKLGLEPVPGISSVGKLRKNLYDWFMTEMPVHLRFIMDDSEDNLEVDVYGRVESCEPDVFERDPKINISILCPQPDFFDRTSVTVSGSTTSSSTVTNVNYAGSVEAGVLFTLNVNRTLSDFSIYVELPNGDLQVLDFEKALVNGDVVRISTIQGNKFVTLTHLGVTSSILPAMSPQSSFIELRKGINKLRVYATGAAIPYTFEYVTKYGAL